MGNGERVGCAACRKPATARIGELAVCPEHAVWAAEQGRPGRCAQGDGFGVARVGRLRVCQNHIGWAVETLREAGEPFDMAPAPGAERVLPVVHLEHPPQDYPPGHFG